jgi:hypothetical protein
MGWEGKGKWLLSSPHRHIEHGVDTRGRSSHRVRDAHLDLD